MIFCDKNGYIISVTESLLHKLKYSAETLEGQFIGILMSDFMAMLHRKFFISAFHTAQGVDKNKLENKLKALHSKRSLIIYDIDKNSHIVSVSITYNDPYFTLVVEFVKESSTLFYSIPNEVSTTFKLNKSDSIIIKTDFIKSTELLQERGIPSLIDISVRFHDTLTKLIRHKYYPFIYLHEVIGDSFIIVLNTDWTYNSETFCGTLAINFICDLVQSTRDFVEIRTGIGYGQIYYGALGSSFNFFGFPMNMAARLEQHCSINEINICQKFHDKLLHEFTLLKIDKAPFAKKNALLKGFGTVDYYSIPINRDTPFLVYT